MTAALIHSILRADDLRWRLLGLVETLALPDCWIGAGFVSNAVWDHLHNRSCSPPGGDVDVIWYDRQRCSADEDRAIETHLQVSSPAVAWSVKNQARMHRRNGDRPYLSATDAMHYWPETATAVAARRVGQSVEIAAPFGLDDLLGLVLRPTPRFRAEKQHIYEERIEAKEWVHTWPGLRKVSR